MKWLQEVRLGFDARTPVAEMFIVSVEFIEVSPSPIAIASTVFRYPNPKDVGLARNYSVSMGTQAFLSCCISISLSSRRSRMAAVS